MAFNQLAAAGFTHVYNIIDGMEGSRIDDPESVFDGMSTKNGWKNSGLPWSYDLDPERTERSVSRGVDRAERSVTHAPRRAAADWETANG